MDPVDVVVRLRPIGEDATPIASRLRRGLKTLLRAYGLKAISVDVAPAPAGSDAGQDLLELARQAAWHVPHGSELRMRLNRAITAAAAAEAGAVDLLNTR